jgi:hypothetical protein
MLAVVLTQVIAVVAGKVTNVVAANVITKTTRDLREITQPDALVAFRREIATELEPNGNMNRTGHTSQPDSSLLHHQHQATAITRHD